MPIESYSYADRWWIPKGSTVAVVAGFFDPEAQGQTTQQRVTYVHSFQSDVPCIVLLGPPGMGKSTEFSRAVSAAQDLGYTAQLIEGFGLTGLDAIAAGIPV